MSFLPPQSALREIPGEGSKTAKICIVGEAGGAKENEQLRPFVGPAGTVLDACLHAAKLTRHDCYVTNVVKIQPRGNDITPFFKINPQTHVGTWSAAGQEWLEKLYAELDSVKSNVVVALGSTALCALTGSTRISRYRGYVMQGLPRVHGRKIIPTYHPAASLRGQYILRYYISADFEKAAKESAILGIVRPERKLVVPTTLSEATEWLDTLAKAFALAIDIEVVNFEVSCICFAPTPELSVSVPMYHEHWTVEEEMVLWRKIANILTSTKIIKIFQNGIFDCHFLATRCGIKVAEPIEDTMIAHSVQYPEMLKGLEFLVSLYCGSQQYYKDMVKWNNIKKEA